MSETTITDAAVVQETTAGPIVVLKPVVLVAGTHGWRNDDRKDWFHPESEFCKRLVKYHLQTIVTPDNEPFIWSTNLGGIGFGRGDHIDWAAAGKQLFWWCVPPLCPEKRLPPGLTTIISHSHGLQVVLYAAAMGLKIDRLISVAGPIRKDMQDTAKKARPNIRNWTHVHSDRSDWWQAMGAMFDGRLGIYRKAPLADRNVLVRGVGHTGLLRGPESFQVWDEIINEVI